MKIKNAISAILAAVMLMSCGVGQNVLAADGQISVAAAADVSGNTFEWYSQSKPVKVRIQNSTSADQTFTVDFYLINDKNRVYYHEKQENVLVSKGKLKSLTVDFGQVQHCDIYNLVMTVKNADGSINMERTLCPVAVVKTDPDGIKNESVGFAAHLEWLSDTSVQDEGVDMLRKSNVYGIRSNFDWDSMETSKGTLDFNSSNMNNVVKKLYANGMELMPVLSGPSRFYFPDENPDEVWRVMPATDAQLEGWKKYVRYTAQQLSAYGVKEYEVWNEPNLKNFNKYESDGAVYAKLIKAAKAEIESVSPSAKVGGAALTGIDGYWGKDYFTQVLKAGGADAIDAITLHPYIDENAAVEDTSKEAAVRWYLDEYAKYSSNTPQIWHTEVGYSSATDGIDEERKGALNTKTALLYKSRGLGDRVILYNFEKKGKDADDKEHQFGHVSPAVTESGSSEVSFVPTKAYAMVTGMNYVAAQSQADRIYDSANGNVRVLSYTSSKFGDKKLLAVYAVGEPEYVTLKLGAESADFYDSYGNLEPLCGNNGEFVVYANDEPCYLVGDFTGVELLNNSFVSVENSSVSVSENGLFGINIEKATDSAYTLEVEAPKNARVVKNSGFDGNIASVVMKNDAAIGDIGRVTIKVKDNGHTAAMFDVDVNTLYESNPEDSIMIDAAAQPKYGAGDRIQIGVNYGNPDPYPMDFTAKYELYYGNELKRTDTELHSIEAEGVCGDTLIIPETASGDYNLKITVLQGETVVKEKSVEFTRGEIGTDNVYSITGSIPSGKEGVEASITVFAYDNDTFGEDTDFSGIYTDQTTAGIGGSFSFRIRVPSDHIRVYIVSEDGDGIDFTFKSEEGRKIVPYLARGMVKAERVSVGDAVQPRYMVELSGLESDIEYDAYCVLYKEGRLVSVVKSPDSVTANDLVYRDYGKIAGESSVDYDQIRLLLWSKDAQVPVCVPYVN